MSKNKSIHRSDFIPQRPPQNTPSSPPPVAPASIKLQETKTSVYSGPIPSSEEMERYNRISPDLMKQIVQMAQDEQKNRFEIERTKLNLAEKESKRADEIVRINSRNTLVGQITAFIIVVLFLLLVGYLGYIHLPIVAGVVGIGGIGTIVYYMTRGSKVEKP